ncbi:MAG: hypothetical protein QOI95_2242 [Acidimicrobiaceae bacterium]
MTREQPLPEGWTSEQFHTRLPYGLLLDPDEHYVVTINSGDFREVVSDLIIRVNARERLCLAREASTHDWFVGDIDDADGSVECWARCGGNLDEAMDSI